MFGFVNLFHGAFVCMAADQIASGAAKTSRSRGGRGRGGRRSRQRAIAYLTAGTAHRVEQSAGGAGHLLRGCGGRGASRGAR